MTAAPLRPIAGDEVIPPSRTPILSGLFVCSVACLAFSLALVAPDTRRDASESPLLRQGVIAVGAAWFACGAYQSVRPCLRRRRLVLAKDRLQLLEGNRVLGQVPFDNIAQVAVRQVGRSFAVLLLLGDYHRPDTCWDSPPGFHDHFKRAEGFDLFIVGFRIYPHDLRKKIVARCQGIQPAE